MDLFFVLRALKKNQHQRVLQKTSVPATLNNPEASSKGGGGRSQVKVWAETETFALIVSGKTSCGLIFLKREFLCQNRLTGL